MALTVSVYYCSSFVLRFLSRCLFVSWQTQQIAGWTGHVGVWHATQSSGPWTMSACTSIIGSIICSQACMGTQRHTYLCLSILCFPFQHSTSGSSHIIEETSVILYKQTNKLKCVYLTGPTHLAERWTCQWRANRMSNTCLLLSYICRAD